MDLVRSRREPPPERPDPESIEAIEDIWAPAAQVATVGIFILLLGVCVYFCRPVLLPVTAALVIGTTLAPIVKAAAGWRISPWVTAIALGAVLLAIAGTAVTLLATPVSEWIARAPHARQARPASPAMAPAARAFSPLGRSARKRP